jgi:Cu/Ag efflux protein CusF
MKRWKIVTSLVVVFILPVAMSAAEVRGVIANVDLKKGELVLDKVKPRTANTTYAVTDKTEVLYGKVAGTLKDLPTGRQVNVEFTESDGKRVVSRIQVHGRPPVAAKAVVDDSMVGGTLRRVALTDCEIVVVGPGAKGAETETTIAVPETARVLRDGKAIPFEELKEGESVTVTVEKHEGRLSAKTLQVGVAAAPAAKESNVVPRLRLVLRLVDGILRQMDERK